MEKNLIRKKMIKVFVLSFALLMSFMHTDTINAESESNSSILVEEYVYDENGMLVNYDQSEIPFFETRAKLTYNDPNGNNSAAKGEHVIEYDYVEGALEDNEGGYYIAKSN